MLIIIEAQNPKEALMNFIALGIISQIDDIFFASLRQEPLKDCISNPPVIKYTKESLIASGVIQPGFSLKRSLYEFAVFTYAIYFYFLPLIVPFVGYISPEIGQI